MEMITNNCGETSEEGNKGPAGGKTKGRQKIEIKPLEKKNNLHVTFSKRRNGMFKKASELCLLTGANIGIVVLSPSPREKPFCFGHPNIEKVLKRYLGETENTTDAAAAEDDDQDGVTSKDLPALEEITKKFEGSVAELEKEKKKGKEMEKGNNGGDKDKYWWEEEEIDGMGVEELEIYVNAMEELKKNLILRANALTLENVMESTNSAPPPDHPDASAAVGCPPQNLSDFGGLQ